MEIWLRDQDSFFLYTYLCPIFLSVSKSFSESGDFFAKFQDGLLTSVKILVGWIWIWWGNGANLKLLVNISGSGWTWTFSHRWGWCRRWRNDGKFRSGTMMAGSGWRFGSMNWTSGSGQFVNRRERPRRFGGPGRRGWGSGRQFGATIGLTRAYQKAVGRSGIVVADPWKSFKR